MSSHMSSESTHKISMFNNDIYKMEDPINIACTVLNSSINLSNIYRYSTYLVNHATAVLTGILVEHTMVHYSYQVKYHSKW